MDYKEGLDFGRGVDINTETLKGEAVIVTEPTAIKIATGATVEFSMRQVQSHQDIAESLEINAGGSFAGIGAKVNYANSLHVTRDSMSLVVRVVVRRATMGMHNVKLSPEATNFLQNNNMEDFHSKFGDGYVKSITSGGEYIGFINFHAESREELEKMSAEVSVNAGLWSASASINSSMSSLLSNKAFFVKSYQAGGPNLNPVNGFDEMIAKAKAFPNDLGNDGVVISAEVDLYSNLILPAGKNPIDTIAQKTVIAQVMKLRNKAMDNLDNINYVLMNQNEYDGINSAKIDELNTGRDALTKFIDNLMQSGSACFNNFNQCQLTLPATIPLINIPTRKSAVPPIVNTNPERIRVRDKMIMPTHLINMNALKKIKLNS